jgi:hypothetical protein
VKRKVLSDYLLDKVATGALWFYGMVVRTEYPSCANIYSLALDDFVLYVSESILEGS